MCMDSKAQHRCGEASRHWKLFVERQGMWLHKSYIKAKKAPGRERPGAGLATYSLMALEP
jgi:hypothetical protein